MISFVNNKRHRTIRNLFYKNLIIVGSLILVIVITAAVYMVFSSNKAIDDQISADLDFRVQKSYSQTYYYLKQLATIASDYSTIVLTPNPEGVDSNYWIKKSVIGNMNIFINTNPYIKSIYLQSDTTILRTNDENSVFTGNPIGTLGNTSILCSDEEIWPSQLVFVFDKYIASYYRKVVVNADIEKLSNLIFSDKSSIDAYEYIVSLDEDIILSPNSSDIHKNISSLFGINKEKLNSSFFKQSFEDNSYYISSKKLDDLDLYAISIVSKDHYVSIVNSRTLQIALFCLGLLIVASIICYIITQISYKPIKDIVNTFKYHIPEDTEQFENEVAYINANIKRSLSSEKNLETELSTKIQKLKSAQIASLQSQINPHFLFNTLEIIKWLSISLIDISNPIEKSLVNLEMIMSASMNQQNNIIPFSKELELTKCYVQLIQLRYSDRFCVNYDIDETLGDCNVMKFIIQPILENAVSHGFRKITHGGIINITARRQDGDMCITISDNGCGIDEDKLADIQAKLNASNDIAEYQSEHIGMYNVHMRIRLLYGNDYGLQIASTVGEGTECKIIFKIDD